MIARRVAALTLLAALAPGVAGCGDPGGQGAARWVGEAEASADPPAQRTPAPAPSTPTGPLTLAFGGDVHFTDRTARLLRDPDTAFGPAAAVLRAADLTVVNLETAVTERGTREPKTYTFRTPPTAFDALRAAGIDAASLANNHALDYGRVGLADTLDNADRAQFKVFGAGRNADAAYAPLIVPVRGVRVGLVGFSQVRDLAEPWAPTADRSGIAMAWDVERSVAAVAAARRDADLVIAFNHWGQEGNACPTADQKRFAAQVAGAGADVIIGAHAHVLQGDGWLGQTYVAYGLGNFLWYSTSHSTDTGILKLTIEGRRVVSSTLVPAVVSTAGQPVPLTGAAATRAAERFAGLRRCTGLADRSS
ncbi:MAG TPA: CapA family protein [Micromonosporaceae bacterium]|nr:CapA family protein [Micromonosporaceae bacterium]